MAWYPHIEIQHEQSKEGLYCVYKVGAMSGDVRTALIKLGRSYVEFFQWWINSWRVLSGVLMTVDQPEEAGDDTCGGEEGMAEVGSMRMGGEGCRRMGSGDDDDLKCRGAAALGSTVTTT